MRSLCPLSRTHRRYILAFMCTFALCASTAEVTNAANPANPAQLAARLDNRTVVLDGQSFPAMANVTVQFDWASLSTTQSHVVASTTGEFTLRQNIPDTFSSKVRITASARSLIRPNTAVSAIDVSDTIVQSANQPAGSKDSWTFVIPALDNAPTPRRTEVFWKNNGKDANYHQGDHLVFECELTGHLGPAAQDDNNWHVLWQLHGPVYGQWPGPAFGLNVRNGNLRLGGGDGHVGQDYTNNNYEYSYNLVHTKTGKSIECALKRCCLRTHRKVGYR